MTDPAPAPSTRGTVMPPDRATPPGMPRWVKRSGIIVAILVLLGVVVMLVSGGEHGPWRHFGGGDAAPSGIAEGTPPPA